MIFARTAAMSFNRWADRKIDAANPRTINREIPSGLISANAVLIFTIINCLAFVTTTYFINQICFFLSPIALIIILGYSYTKRFTFLCHLILGIGLALAPIGGYLAVTGKFDIIPILFSFAVLFWVAGFDVIYSLQDDDFDADNQLYSIPSYFGGNTAMLISRSLHLITVILMGTATYLCVVNYGVFGFFVIFGMLAFIAFLVYQHTLVKPKDLSNINLAFFTANGIASVLFGVCFILDIFVI